MAQLLKFIRQIDYLHVITADLAVFWKSCNNYLSYRQCIGAAEQLLKGRGQLLKTGPVAQCCITSHTTSLVVCHRIIIPTLATAATMVRQRLGPSVTNPCRI